MPRSMLIAGVMMALLGSARASSADDIPCPVQKATWEITTPLADPWSGPTEVGTLVKQVSAFINARDWIICIYANDNDADQRSVFHYQPYPALGPGAGAYLISVSRPPPSNGKWGELECPVAELSVGLKTNVRSPWTSTTYVFRFQDKVLHTHPLPQRVVCQYASTKHDVWGAGPSAILRPVKPDTGPGLTSTPKPSPSRPDTLTAAFGVTAVTLTTGAEVRAACPANVKFRGYIHANGAGTVRYRVVHNGRPGGAKEMNFDRAEGRPVLFDVEVGGGDSSDSVTARPKPAAPGSITAAPAPGNRLSGWARIEILAPHAGVTRSDIASYVVSCTRSGPDRLKKDAPYSDRKE